MNLLLWCLLPCRPRSPSYYTLHFNGDAARLMLDAELAGVGQQARQKAPQPAAASNTLQQVEQDGWRSHPFPASKSSNSSGTSGSNGDGSASEGGQQQPKRVLIGHSMGGAAAAEGVISNPKGVAALVLVAPAVVALWLGPPDEAAGDAVATGGQRGSRKLPSHLPACLPQPPCFLGAPDWGCFAKPALVATPHVRCAACLACRIAHFMCRPGGCGGACVSRRPSWGPAAPRILGISRLCP